MATPPAEVGRAYENNAMEVEGNIAYIIAYVDHDLAVMEPGKKMYFVTLSHHLNWLLNQNPETFRKIEKAYLESGWSKVKYTAPDRTISLYK